MSLASALEQYAPHHKELKERLLKSILVITLTTVATYMVIDQIVAFCMQPLFVAYPELQKLVYTKLTEAFITYLKLALISGVIISSPFVLYQIWLFVSPGLIDKERRLVRIVIFWSTFLFAGGVAFSYFVALPQVLTFFMSYAGPNLQPMPKLGLYLTFVARMALAFGIAFEIPFLMYMVCRTGLVSRGYFKKNRLYFYIAIVVLSFLLSAGELTATVLLSFPLFGLYESGMLLAKIFIKEIKEKKEESAE